MSVRSGKGRGGVLAAAALLVAAAGCVDYERQDLADALRRAPGVLSVEEQPSQSAGFRVFFLEFEQPVDHFARPGAGTFRQFVSVAVRARGRPVVFLTNGYHASRMPYAGGGIVTLLGANQVTVEHRFFDPSSPEPKDWPRLTIEQAAADHHRVVEALRPILGGRWISAGASKGGMTAVYHRWLYPDDVDGTLAYVAPQSFAPMDPAYAAFLEQVGTADCRQRLRDYQRAMLTRRAELDGLQGCTPGFGCSSSDVLGADRSFDLSVLEFPFTFWQYGGDCEAIPASDAPAVDLAFFMDWIADWVVDYQAYFYQSATQLGGPEYPQAHLADLPGWPIVDHPADYPPLGVSKPWDAGKMAEVGTWVRTQARDILFIYGDMDPWSAHMFEPNPARGVRRYVVAGGNHSAGLTQLPGEERAEAEALLRGWAGVSPAEGGPGAALATPGDPAGETRWLLESEPGYRWASRRGALRQ